MTKYVVFLRGVNVGGRIIKMADLKVCLEKAGLQDVATLLQSGNVVFVSDKPTAELKKLIETTLSKTFSYPAKAQVLSMDKLAKVVKEYPFGIATDKQHDYVVFMENCLEQVILADNYNLGEGEKVQAGDGVLYWRVDQGQTLRSSFGKILAKSKYREFNTNRNLKTLRKLLAL